MNVDSLRSVIAELRSSGYDRDGMHDKWADRLERIDAEMRVKCAAFDQILALVREWLPPDSKVMPEAFIQRVIGAVDNPEVADALRAQG